MHGFLRDPDGRITTIDVKGAGTGAGQGTSITTLSAMDSANDRLRLRSRHSYPST
jgi:hypothetical protein